MRPEELHKTPKTLESPPIIRRLGEKPSHKDCDCPASWTSVVQPYERGQDSLFALAIEPQTLANGAERNHITEQVQRIDGSGGIAAYEDFGVVKQDGNLVLSIAAVCLQTGVRILPNGDLQLPLFILPNTAPLLRWNIEALHAS